MKKAPTPQKKANPLLLGGGAVVLLAAYLWSSSDSGPAPTTTPKRTTRTQTAKTDGLITEADKDARFPRLTLAAIDAFNPLIKKAPPTVVAPPVTDETGIPKSLTGGGTWYYTGWVELNGRRQALLENPTTGESAYVNQGERWKQARIGTIDVSTVVLIDASGKSYFVPIQDYGTVPGQAAPAPEKDTPLNVPSGAIAGAIGSGPTNNLNVRPVAGTATMTLPDGRTVQVPLDATAATNDGGGNGGRRNRRNRNNNSGISQNAP